MVIFTDLTACWKFMNLLAVKIYFQFYQNVMNSNLIKITNFSKLFKISENQWDKNLPHCLISNLKGILRSDWPLNIRMGRLLSLLYCFLRGMSKRESEKRILTHKFSANLNLQPFPTWNCQEHVEPQNEKKVHFEPSRIKTWRSTMSKFFPSILSIFWGDF